MKDRVEQINMANNKKQLRHTGDVIERFLLVFAVSLVASFIFTEYDHFLNARKYKEVRILILNNLVEQDIIYERGDLQGEGCQNAEKWPSCDEMISRKKIGSCHDLKNYSCLGEYVWLDDWGYQITDFYTKKSINHYPRSIIYEKTRWNVTSLVKVISTYYSIYLKEYFINYSTTKYYKLIDYKNIFRINEIYLAYYDIEADEIVLSPEVYISPVASMSTVVILSEGVMFFIYLIFFI